MMMIMSNLCSTLFDNKMVVISNVQYFSVSFFSIVVMSTYIYLYKKENLNIDKWIIIITSTGNNDNLYYIVMFVNVKFFLLSCFFFVSFCFALVVVFSVLLLSFIHSFIHSVCEWWNTDRNKKNKTRRKKHTTNNDSDKNYWFI